jgi:hypothetical protein
MTPRTSALAGAYNHSGEIEPQLLISALEAAETQHKRDPRMHRSRFVSVGLIGENEKFRRATGWSKGHIKQMLQKLQKRDDLDPAEKRRMQLALLKLLHEC